MGLATLLGRLARTATDRPVRRASDDLTRIDDIRLRSRATNEEVESTFNLPKDSFIFRHERIDDTDPDHPRIVGRILGKVDYEGGFQGHSRLGGSEMEDLYLVRRTDDLRQYRDPTKRMSPDRLYPGKHVQADSVMEPLSDYRRDAVPTGEVIRYLVSGGASAARTGLGGYTGLTTARALESDRSPAQVPLDDWTALKQTVSNSLPDIRHLTHRNRR